MRNGWFVALGLLVIAGLACSFSLGGDSVGEATNGEGGDTNVLYQDDFSNTGSGWDRSTFDEGSSDYANGGYRIVVNATDYSVWANPNQTTYTDTRVEVDATKTGGPDDNEFGIICRHADPSNYYAAVISSDGFFGFWKRVAGADLELVGMTEFGQSAAINQGSASNHIRLDCVGSTLTLYANGTLLGSVTDTTHTSGDVGLYAGTFDQSGTDILFDNFVVYQP
ncbi:MAG: hypothetical protein ACRDFQ_01205 [Anaerolineales bacterium]